MLRTGLMIGGVLMFTTVAAQAATVTATINMIDSNGVGAVLGTVSMKDTRYGLLIEPNLMGLPAGAHGFHVHENGSCGAAAKDGKSIAGLAAGGHYDPKHTGKHLGPESTEGHKGDLPVLVVDAIGKATLPVLAPHLKTSDLHGKSLMIHAGGDNYADEPAPLGGGGPRVACGVIK